METIKKILEVVFSLLLGALFATFAFFVGFTCGEQKAMKGDTVSVSMFRYDTIKIYKPVPRDSVVVKYVTERLPKVVKTQTDTITLTDTVEVAVPITQRIYEDTLYTAYVSGYKAHLDSMRIRSKVTTLMRTVYVKKNTHWGVGVQVGYGVGHGGATPYIGLGVSYNILKW